MNWEEKYEALAALVDGYRRERDEARANLDAEYLRHADAFRLAREQIEHWQRRSGSAFERGAEAMREACACVVEDADDGVALQCLADGLREQPIPEEP